MVPLQGFFFLCFGELKIRLSWDNWDWESKRQKTSLIILDIPNSSQGIWERQVADPGFQEGRLQLIQGRQVGRFSCEAALKDRRTWENVFCQGQPLQGTGLSIHLQNKICRHSWKSACLSRKILTELKYRQEVCGRWLPSRNVIALPGHAGIDFGKSKPSLTWNQHLCEVV